MTDLTLSQIRLLVEIVEQGSFRAAAMRLDMPPSTLSRQVAGLESRLGVRLFNRTTRSVALTEDGTAFLARATPALREIESAMTEMTTRRAEPGGLLRINGAESGLALLLPVVARLQRRYSGVEIDLVEDGQLSDIVAQGFDAGLRLAEDVPRDMVAVPVGPDQRFIVVGAPDYLERNPAPQRPADLAHHVCIRARKPSGRVIQWEFARNGNEMTVPVTGMLTLGNNALALEAARLGCGLAYVTEQAASADLIAGRLAAVLDDWCASFPGICLYYPKQRAASVTLRALISEIRRR
ncbi:LysR family transcriptional regulator [Rhizobium sp. EC-SD404]|uniref:LysR family transcriptional regulator n=1 Tax=Rhizobium sp. EC-SD404 TaxID=2038389 RepID=UPI001259D95E|nr:LysR family transcriptional regulator [Rhizobium sp. EC-SD404]VVS99190.1 Transcriptional regulator, LysR family [Rhizobium sp. EC-SD404]